MKTNKCIDCPNKNIDKYGWLCDISCGEHFAWLNYQEGIKEVWEWIQTHALIKPDGASLTQFIPFYQVGIEEPKEWEKEWEIE